MRIRARSARDEPTPVELPDGRRIVLDRPFGAYSTAELAELGIVPSLGDGGSAWLVPSTGRRWRRALRPRRP